MLHPQAAAVAARLDRQAKEVEDAWQIPAEEAALLHQLVVAARCRSILEIGVSYGYSTLHFAHAAKVVAAMDGRSRDSGPLPRPHVHAIDASEKKFYAARASLAEAGVIDAVTLHLGRAQDVLPSLRPVAPFDFVFIDAVKSECGEYLDAAWPFLAPRCIVATDNTLTHADELVDFISHLRSHPQIASSATIAIGNGVELSVRG